MTFKEKLVILRKAKGLTQDEFAAAVGVSRQAVYKWECGQSYPEVPKLLEMKLLFTISIDELLDDSIDIPVPEKKKRKRTASAEGAQVKAPQQKKAAPIIAEVKAKEEKPAAAPIQINVPKVVEEKKEEAAPAPKVAPVAEAAPAPKETTINIPKIEESAPIFDSPKVKEEIPEIKEVRFDIPKIEETPLVDEKSEERPINIPRPIIEEYDDVEEEKEDDSNKRVGFFGRIFGRK